MNQQQRDREVANEMQRRLLQSHVCQSCLNCERFGANTLARGEAGVEDQCTLVQRVPPPKVIVYGCENWSPDIPF